MNDRAASFYRLRQDQSRVKSYIVSKYFVAWARVMLGRRRMANRFQTNKNIHYIEAYCGPGTYEDGTQSTPLMVLQAAIGEPRIAQHLVTHFIDHNESYCSRLEEAIASLPGVDGLAYPPRIVCHDIDAQLARTLRQHTMVPTLLFADPWGYKGLSMGLFDAVLKDFGSECVFFFNYNRINAAVTNPMVTAHINGLFGQDTADHLRESLPSLSPYGREEEVMRCLDRAFQASSRKLVLTFCFRKEEYAGTSHYLVFATKHFRGYDIMKSIMAMYSSSEAQGVSTFMYDPTDRRSRRLLEVGQPLEDLRHSLLSDHEAQTISFDELYRQHSVGRPYVRRNYKQALYELFEEGAVKVSRPPRKGTFADTIEVTFPPYSM